MKNFENGKMVTECNGCNKKETNPINTRNWVSLAGVDKIISCGKEINLPLYPDSSVPDLDFCSIGCLFKFFSKYFEEIVEMDKNCLCRRCQNILTVTYKDGTTIVRCAYGASQEKCVIKCSQFCGFCISE